MIHSSKEIKKWNSNEGIIIQHYFSKFFPVTIGIEKPPPLSEKLFRDNEAAKTHIGVFSVGTSGESSAACGTPLAAEINVSFKCLEKDLDSIQNICNDDLKMQNTPRN